MSITFHLSEHIDDDRERVFRTLTDLDGADEWMPGLIGIELLSEGDFGPGTAWRETRKIFGREATEHFEVTRVEAPERISLIVDGSKGATKKGEYLFDYRLSDDESGTRVDLYGEIRGLGTFAGLLARLFVGSFKKACLKDLQALKEHLEG